MKRAYLIGLDIGTSGAKCIIAEGRVVVASKTVEYPLYTPSPDGQAGPGGLVEGHPGGLPCVMAAGIDRD